MSDKPWLKYYAPKVPAKIPETAESLLDLYQTTLRKHSDKKAISCHGHDLTFAEVDHYADRFATCNMKWGLRNRIPWPSCCRTFCSFRSLFLPF